jgi:hypothetical protein
MTKDKRTAWIEQVWTSLRAVPTGSSVAQLGAAWHNHQKRKHPVAAIFGVYDAGKSSLLKRLLFEEGAEVPESLTVSGRRETFSVDDIDGAAWTYRDSPGIAGGNEEHNQKAIESLELADLLIWVLPPQLVTSDKELFNSIATGERFAVGPGNVSASLMAVVSRIEEAGIDPDTNPAGFSDLCVRKKAEFTALLDSVRVAPPSWGIFPVSADPYQGVGNEAPDATIYAMGEGWDGVPELRAALERAVSFADELRTLAGLRYASSAVRELSSTVRHERTQREEVLQTSTDELERFNLWQTNIQGLRDKCAAELHRTVEDELLSESRTGAASPSEALHKNLSAAIDRWGRQAYAEFEQLAKSAKQEVGRRARSPSMEQLKRLILELCDAEPHKSQSDTDGLIKRHAGRLGRSFQEGFKAYARLDLGMSIEEAANHLRKYHESGKTWAEFAKDIGKGKSFASEEVATKASKYVKWAEAIHTFGPLVEQLGTVVYEISGEILSEREAAKKAKRRNEIRDAIRAAAADVETKAMTWFDVMTSAFSAWLGEQEKMTLAAKSSFEAQIAALKGYEATLDALMRERPT